jgi:hypothetical protein
MTFRLKIEVALLIITLPLTLAAQDFRPGYIIKNTGDSLSGFVSYRIRKNNQETGAFKTDVKSKPVRFISNELKGYGFYNDKIYETLQFSHHPQIPFKGPVFAKVLAKGPLMLYRIGELFIVKNNDTLMILPKPEDKIIKVGGEDKLQRDKRYVSLLNSMMSDCKIVANEVSYAEGPLQKILEKFNECKNVKPMKMNRPPFLFVNFSLFANYAKSKLDINYLDKHTSFSTSNTFGAGTGIDISSPRIFDRAYLSIELWYTKAFHQALNTGFVNYNALYQDVLLDVSTYKIPIGIRYDFLKAKSTPYVKLGFSLAYVGKISLRTMEDQVTSDKMVYSSAYNGYNDYILKKNPKALWACVGYSRTVYSQMKAFAEFRLETGDGYFGTKIQNFSSLRNYNFLIGLRF